MSVKTRSQLKAENATDFPNNTTRLITPAALRGQMDDIVDSALFPEDDIEGSPGLPGPPGSDGASIDGITALRGMAPSAGFTVRLNYHTTCGDYGAGLFRGVTSGGPYTDNGGTIIVPGGGTGSAAWLRVWDQVKAHVGWFGAKCQPDQPTGPDDYDAVQKCFYLFTSGRTTGGGFGGGTITTGVIDVGPGFNFSQPLIYGGSNSGSLRLVGHQSNAAGGQEKSLLRYIGPAAPASIYFYGACHWAIENINTYPGLAHSGVAVIADNTYNHTATHAITAGTNVVVTPSGADAAAKIFWLQVGCFLGIGGISAAGGAVAGADFEIVQVTAVDTVAGTFTANFTKDHANGCQIGGSTA